MTPPSPFTLLQRLLALAYTAGWHLRDRIERGRA